MEGLLEGEGVDALQRLIAAVPRSTLAVMVAQLASLPRWFLMNFNPSGEGRGPLLRFGICRTFS